MICDKHKSKVNKIIIKQYLGCSSQITREEISGWSDPYRIICP